ncbi:ABC transporter permease [Enterococcus sp.]|jgi:ABC-2 type transport system permease protein|uniref:ABC transporter permease n=1 Tax=Enterococcus sp. TaxID=35783 RepID=UPI0028A5F2DE|nr:ABC-2 family transporter protein [Enterococcus sp.]
MVYWHYFCIHLKSQMQYKVSFIFTALGQFLGSLTAFLGIWFMFTRFHQVNGFRFEEVLLCFATVLLSYSMAECFGRGFDLFPQMISNGEFDRALVRPRSLIFQVLASKMEFSRIGRLLQAVLVFFYAIPRSGVNWHLGTIVTLCLMIICGSIFFSLLFLVYAAISFFTIQGLEFMNIFTDGAREFGRYPFSIYGKQVLRILTYVVPMAWFQYYPFLYLIGQRTNPWWIASPLVCLVFAVPAIWFWRVGLKNYVSTGS